MSAEGLGWVFRHSPYDGATFAVHLALADSANDQHDYEIWMTQATIAAKARMSTRAVRNAVARLVDDGYLTLLDANADVGGRNRYRLEFPEVEVVFETRGRRNVVPPGGRNVVPGEEERGSSSEREPKREPKTPPSAPHGGATDDGGTFPTAAAIRTGTPYPAAFEAFWGSYPRRIGKAAAYKAWLARISDARKAKIPLERRIEMMCRAAANYASSVWGKDLEFVKYPATFLGPAEHWKEWATADRVRPDVAASPRQDPGLIYQEI